MKYSKTLSLFLGLVIFISAGITIAPRPAHALFGVGDVVLDPTNLVQTTISAGEAIIQTGLAQQDFLKEFVLDPLAYKLADVARESITKSVINWVGSGFDGSPAFVTNLQENLLQVGDARAESFLAQLASDNRIDSPFKSSVLESTRAAYYQNTGTNAFGAAHPYTLNQDCADAEGFLAGRYFDLSCWRAALAPQNNPYGSEILATDALLNQVDTAHESRTEEYRAGSGFLGWRGGSCGSSEGGEDSVSLSVTDNSLNCPIQTPGSFVIEAAKKAGFSDIDRIVSADEIDEALLNLAGSLLNKIGGDGGLLSAGDSTGGGVRPAEGGSGGSVVESFLRVLDGQISQIGPYQTNLQTIKTAAEGALQRCGQTGTGATFAKDELAKANTALGSSASALSQLQTIRTDVTTSTAVDKTAVVVDASARYDALRKSATFPTPTQIAYAYSESQDIEGTVVYTLKRMNPGRFSTCSI